ncbi:hypothetical protein AB0F17_65155 [Nonomuraea sp. NPDC026600]|uniref:hypothetical protein n=1 Tax=Nonomuraea sp. NPDC026600 TaxID=3155363 RepID=UPI0033C51284
MRSDSSPDTTVWPEPSPAKRPRDVRGFWRLLLAVLAPLPMLAQAVNYLLSPVEGGDPFTDTAAVIAGHLPLMGGLRWLDAAFVAGIVPATFAVAWAARRWPT